MLRSARITCLLILAGVPPAQDTAQDQDDIPTLLARVEEQGDRVDRAVLEELGRRADSEAFEALGRCVAVLQSRPALNAACEAFRHMRATQMEPAAISFLASKSRARHAPLRRAAVRGLRLFGDPARASLEKIVHASRYPTARHLAVGGLIPALRLAGTTEALEVLLDEYRVPESGPERLAVATLRTFEGDDALAAFEERLRHHSYPGQMKLVIIDVLTTMQGERVDELLLRLTQQSPLSVLDSQRTLHGTFDYAEPALVVAAIEALTARGHTDHLADLQRLVNATDPNVRRAALVGQGPLQSEPDAWVRRLFDLSGHFDPALRKGAASALAALGTPAAREALYRFLRDEEESVRFEAYCAVGDLRHKGSVPVLIERLGAESSHLRWSPYFELRMVTGEDHGLSKGRWRTWWEDVGGAFVVPSHEHALAREEERRKRGLEHRTQASFYGLPVTSDRVCLVLDVSISMKELTSSGETRLRVSQRQLIQLLGRYPLGNRLNLVFFAFGVHPFRRRLVVLDEDTRREALRFIWDQPIRGGTSIWEALAFALDDADVEAIYLLTDGEPTSGEFKSVPRIVKEIRSRRKIREFTVHCVDVGGGGRRLLERLAETTGGQLVETQ